MLKRLDINNIALIDSLSVDFSLGMNCLTGETGAGKSIIIDSIGCILGERTSRELLRTGSETASVHAFFVFEENSLYGSNIASFLSENKIPFEGKNLDIFREFDRGGKNSCKVNGKSVPLAFLKTLGTYLIDIHGQHDNQSLLRTETHISLLDMFGGDNTEKLLSQYRSMRSDCASKIALIKRLSGDPAERARKIDLLNYQANEISAARLKPDEEENLTELHKLLANSEKITESLSEAYNAISEGTGGGKYGDSSLSLLGNAAGALKSISGISKNLEDIHSRCEDILYSLEDLSGDIRKELSNLTFDPDELEKTDARLDTINSLKRKYGNTIPEIIAFGEKARDEAEKLQGSESLTVDLQNEVAVLHEKMKAICLEIHENRVKTAKTLEDSITKELADLEMPGASFIVDICYDGADDPVFGNNGLDTVEFLMSANRGELAKPLSRVASGGELSRIMLAIKTILAGVDAIPTMIFDEIDIGISGKTASSLGDKLKYISSGHQVICVTHLAQLAARANHNIIVSKSFDGTSTKTEVTIPDEKSLEAEIARLLDGNSESDIALAHAKELLSRFH